MSENPTRIDAQEYARTLTGFDEIAIEKAFRKDLDDLSGNMSVRALMFVKLRRDGEKDGPAYTAAMQATAGQLRDMWSPGDEAQAGGDQGKAAPGPELEPGQTSS